MTAPHVTPCPNCQSSNTVRIGQLVGTWLHFCFACGRRFEVKDEKEKESR